MHRLFSLPPIALSLFVVSLPSCDGEDSFEEFEEFEEGVADYEDSIKSPTQEPEPVLLDSADDLTNGPDVAAGVVPCQVDNDWTGSNICNPSSHHSAWTKHTSSSWGYFWNDVRYTSASWKTGHYYWTAPTSGTVNFFVWIPSNKATADVEYEYYCASGPGDYSTSTTVINQASFFSQWKYVGSKTSTAGYTCGIHVQKANNASGSELVAMDAAQADFYY